MKQKAICPCCDKETELSISNPYRPFCSKRCRLIDLGEWINESYTISETNIENDYFQKPIQKH
jgi:endogenous inhibitor of DNA gyrase (YacG/DUF329 family)